MNSGKSEVSVPKPIFNLVQRVVADALEIDLDSVHFDSLVIDFPDWDSLGFIKIILGLSDKFITEIDAERLVDCESVEQICAYLTTIVSS